MRLAAGTVNGLPMTGWFQVNMFLIMMEPAAVTEQRQQNVSVDVAKQIPEQRKIQKIQIIILIQKIVTKNFPTGKKFITVKVVEGYRVNQKKRAPAGILLPGKFMIQMYYVLPEPVPWLIMT